MIAVAIVLFAAPTEPPMDKPLIAALDRALAGDEKTLDGLGVEEAIVTSPLWDDRVSVDGKGAVTYTSRRSAGDKGGTPVGLFRTTMEPAELQALIKAVRQLAIAPPPPARSEAYETRILLSAVAEGHVFSIGAPAQPVPLEPLRPVMNPLQRCIMKAFQTPVRSLAISLELPDGVSRGGVVPVVVKLRNDGTEGYWVTNPAAVPNQPEHERIELVYARPIVFTPGIAPVPVTPQRTTLSPRDGAAEEPKFRWIPPKGEVAVALQGKIATGDASELVFRAAFFADEGPDVVAGQPRLRGTVFSPDVKVPIK